MALQEIFANTMYILGGIVFLIVAIGLIHDKIKYGVFFEENRPKEIDDSSSEESE